MNEFCRLKQFNVNLVATQQKINQLKSKNDQLKYQSV